MDRKIKFEKLFSAQLGKDNEDNLATDREMRRYFHDCNIYETEDGKRRFIVRHTDWPESPRDWGNPWKLNINVRGEIELEEFDGNERVAMKVPVYGYSHSGLVLSLTPFSDRWDSGVAGMAFLKADTFKKEFNSDKDMAVERLEWEIKMLNMVLSGNVYTVEAWDFNGTEWEKIDSLSEIYEDSAEKAVKDYEFFDGGELKTIKKEIY